VLTLTTSARKLGIVQHQRIRCSNAPGIVFFGRCGGHHLRPTCRTRPVYGPSPIYILNSSIWSLRASILFGITLVHRRTRLVPPLSTGPRTSKVNRPALSLPMSWGPAVQPGVRLLIYRPGISTSTVARGSQSRPLPSGLTVLPGNWQPNNCRHSESRSFSYHMSFSIRSLSFVRSEQVLHRSLQPTD